ncbi:MAG: NifU family protein [Actinomycetota bacterium]|nr:NifU family protein [Actinomycetota bacterium]
MTAAPAELPPEVAAALGQLDELIQMFVDHPDENVQDGVIAVLRAVDILHRGGLQRVAAFLEQRSLLEEAQDDAHMALLFDLYGSREIEDERDRAEAAVAGIRPYVESHGGRLEVVTAEGGVITIRLLGACESCSGSTAGLRDLVEEALRAELPEFVRMDVSSSAEHTSARNSKRQPVVIPAPTLSFRSATEVSPGRCGAGGGSCGCSNGA